MSRDNRAETSFRQAINTARSQQAKLLELRATVSLQHLHLAQGKIVRSDQRLPNIYEWFREGFDTPDLQEGQPLLCKIKISDVED